MFTSTAIAQSTYNTANVQNYFQTSSSSDLRTFCNQLDTNWLGTWQSKFTISAHYTSDLLTLDTNTRKQVIYCTRRLADQKDAGLSIDYSGFHISDNGNSETDYTIHTDCAISWCCPVTTAASFWITEDRK